MIFTAMIQPERFLRGVFTVMTLVCLVGLACETKPNESANSLSRLPFGSTDIPHSGEIVRGRVPMGGWALSDDEISRIAIFVDRSYVMTATLGGPRPDVAKLYPSLPNSGESGWNAVLDTTSLQPGNHAIVVQAYSKQGAARDIGDVTVTVAK
jgi:hypothetical protein